MEICLSSSPPRVSPRDSLPPSWLFRSLAGVRGGDGNLLEVLALGSVHDTWEEYMGGGPKGASGYSRSPPWAQAVIIILALGGL